MRKSTCMVPALLAGMVLCAGAAPENPPNIILVLADDSGYSDLGCYGSEIQTPNLDDLGTNGLRFTQFYNTARCSPTRASLMTGLYSWQAGIGHLVEDYPQPGYTPALNRKCVTMAEALKTAGYGTYMSGKWHIGGVETNQLPRQRGFDHYFGTLVNGGSTLPSGDGYYGSNYWLDNTYTNVGSGPYSIDRFTDYALQFLDGHMAQTNAPFFLYLAFTAPHFDLTAPPEGIGKYRNTFMDGWEAHRQQRFARQQALGIVKPGWVLSPPDHTFNWNSLSAAEKDTQDLAMATHSAMVENIDKNVGRVVDFLKANNLYTNTVIFFLSDNGASNEGGNGGLSTATRLSTVGANWSNTPWRLYKKYVREGGVSTPLIIHWPTGIAQPAIRWQPGHLIDLMPTVLELSGATYPAKFHGNPIRPLEGMSLVPTFNSTNIVPRTLFFEHEGNRAIRSNDWKIVSIGRNTLDWELFNLADNRSETNNVAAAHPDIVASLASEWERMAWRVNDFPSPDVNNYVKMRSWITVDDTAGGDGDGQPEPGETVNLTIETIKRGTGVNTGLTGTLASSDSNVVVLAGTSAYGDFGSGKASNLAPFQIHISTNAPVNQSLLFTLRLDLGSEEQWSDVVALVVRSYSQIEGKVTEAGNGEPLRNATVAGGMVASTTSDAFGDYRLLLESGPYDLAASLDGYATTQRMESVTADADEDFALAWNNPGLSLRFDRPYPAFIAIPTNLNMTLRATVHNGPYPGNGPVAVAWFSSGPAPAVFGDASAEDTTVVFPQSGTYMLNLVADNGSAFATQSVSVTVGAAGTPSEPSTSALVLQFKLDESAGAVAADSSGSGHVGNLLNMDTLAAWTTGGFSNALHFDGVNDVLALNTSVLINNQITPQRTISLWFRADDPSLSTKQTLYEEGGSTRGISIYLTNGKLYAGGWNRDATQSNWTGDWISTTAPQAGTWHHVALVLNGGPTVQPDCQLAYLDGFEFGRSQGSQIYNRTDAIGFGAAHDATRFHDGTTVGQTDGAWFAGIIDEARIYNRVLTPAEIAGLANPGDYSRVVQVDAGPDQPLHSGLAVPLAPQIQLLGPAPYPFRTEWTVTDPPASSSVLFSQPDTNGIPTLATLGQSGEFAFRLKADTGDVASYDDVSVAALRSFDEWIGGFGSLAPADHLPEADPDSDLASNAMEYELGTPPDCAGCPVPALRPAISVTNQPSTDVHIQVFLRRGAMERGLGLAVQRRSDLLSGIWSGCPFTIGSIDDTADFEFQRLHLDLQLTPEESAEPANFFRPVFSDGL
ncbi:MAG: sulfatase-like hydrolase/transferase [Kiritimatiellales bacterium]|nr:sulfatase-like hydrolase/transferase [Kiritimatiellales bacterium]